MNTTKFFNSINFDLELNADIKSVILKRSTETFTVTLTLKEYPSADVLFKLFECAAGGINKQKKCVVKIECDTISEDDILNTFNFILQKMIEDSPSLSSLSEATVTLNDNIINIEVATNVDTTLVNDKKKYLLNKLSAYGINNIDIETTVNVEKNNKIKDEIQKEKESGVVIKKEDSPIILGKHIDGETTNIDDIVGEASNIINESYVFGFEGKSFEKTNIVNLKISDNTNSMLAKFFVRDKDEFNAICKKIKEGKWYRFHGYVKYDTFAKDLVFNVNNMEAIDSKEQKIVDEAPVKRVELHTHTMMSAMDGVIEAKSLVKAATSMGMKAIAVTDHNCVQAFPELFHAV